MTSNLLRRIMWGSVEAELQEYVALEYVLSQSKGII